MGRPRKQSREPFWRTGRNCWYVHHGSTTVRLSPDREEAWRLWHELMARPPERRAETPADPSALAAVEVIDLFLEWCAKNRDRLTYEAYRRRLQCLADAIPATLRYGDLKPYYLTRVTDAKGWNSTTKNDFIAAVQRAFNWALAEGIIDRHPLAKVKKPPRQARELAITPRDYAEAMAHVAEPNFRELLELAWETGVRPQEIVKIEARFLDRENRRVVMPPSEAKGKKYHRVIYLGSDRAFEIVSRLAEERPSGPLLLNSEGRPWNKDSINCAFCRLKKKLGRKLHLGAWRKGYATEALKAGVDVIGLAHLMGHRDPTMLSRVYAKVQQDPEYMAGLARKAKRQGRA
jgi:integrase